MDGLEVIERVSEGVGEEGKAGIDDMRVSVSDGLELLVVNGFGANADGCGDVGCFRVPFVVYQ